MNRNPVTLVAAASFEERSLVTTRKFLTNVGEPRDVHLANVIEDNVQHQENVDAFRELRIEAIEPLDRFDSRALWSWAWKTIRGAPRGDIAVDITCFPRELLGMLLFAISLMRKRFVNVTVDYIAAPEGGYATQNTELDESARWLSKGVRDIRSIIGFPGDFSGEKTGHLIALAGHERERLMEIVEYVEPRKLSIGSGDIGSSTTAGADEYSRRVVRALRSRVPVPTVERFGFRSDSVDDVYERLREVGLDFGKENVSLAGMNTKLSFVGATLFALHERRVRIVYAVPEKYNPSYCQGVGTAFHFDITGLIGQAKTEAL
ncbi:MAG: hypothetical protein OXE73_05360 [Gammaproteobacteria bacterium]|nr:hypothetical protein [Gammaproteobacteria bacterium]